MATLHMLRDPLQAAQWLHERVTGTLVVDSRKLVAGDGFVAWPGAAVDGRRFVPAALAAGARACLVEAQGIEAFGFDDPRVVAYANLKAATGPIAAAYFEQPSQQLDVLAVTGTNGKTSTVWWLAQALSSLQKSEQTMPVPCGQIGTLGIGQPPRLHMSGLTTPDPVMLQQAFRQFLDEGLTACAIEASSIGLAERRLDGTHIRVAMFTNFTQDHLDYHGSMQAYWRAKAELFNWPGLQAAVVNVDDAQGEELAMGLQARDLDTWTVSCQRTARLRARSIVHTTRGLQFEVVEGKEQHLLATSMLGEYNVSNLLGVLAAMRALGVPLAAAVEACARITPVPGRMECIGEADQPLVVVDYAHTPDALDKALAALHPLAAARGGKLWCIFGCGGDRDAAKRPVMAAVAEKHADYVMLTSDNPRSEKPEHIISQVLLGMSHGSSVRVEADRAKAIAETVQAAASMDVILLAGKGHEDYQEIGGIRRPFSDPAHARAALAQRTSAARPNQGICS